jgi:YHS domain-containing protein
MKNITAILTLSVGILLLAGCANTGSATASAKPYPLKTCIVTDNELGSMGTPITKVHNGQTVKFCCKPCVREFQAEPEKFLSKLNGIK